jgi:hypothetical protein
MVRVLLLLALGFSGGDAGVGGSAPGGPRAPAVPTLPTLLSPLPPPLPPPGSQPSSDEYRLLRARDGSGDLLYEAAGFGARVARDGSVTFRDRHVTGVKLFPFWPPPWARSAPTGGASLESLVRGLGKGGHQGAPTARADPTADETASPATTVSRFRPDTREACQYPRPCFFDASVLLVGLKATFDITDEVMRLAGQDPYRYQKARFLTATRDLRIRMAGRAHAEDVSRSAASLPGLLKTIACDDRLGASERRAIIEALRAELDVDTPEAGAYGEEIRRFMDALDRADGGVPCPAR